MNDNRTDFQLIFDGDALANNEINPRILSNALVGMDELLEAANHILNPDDIKIEVKVKANFEKGCFKISFATVQSLWEQTKTLFSSDGMCAAVNALAILGCVFTGLSDLLKFLKGKRPTKIQETENKEFIVYSGTESITVSEAVVKLFKEYKVRRGFESLVSPLENKGIDDFAVMTSGSQNPLCHIQKHEKDYFKCPCEDLQPLEPLIYETRLNLINISFKEDNKWYVNDGRDSFYAEIEDKAFLGGVNASITKFSKDDVLKVRIRQEQSYNLSTGKLKSEFFIEEVVEHITPENIPMLF